VADRISEERRSYNMRQIKSSNTGIEIAVRKMIHGMGYRYRLHDQKLPGSPDIVFSGRRKVIFVHGCFWHQHPDPSCLDSRPPKSNQDYWLPKLARTQERDRTNQKELSEQGWESLVVWECEMKNKDALCSGITEFLES
jgi:DNA mismatch endonuclease (patch repair protein)